MCSCSWSHHRSERSASHSVTLPRAAQTPARPRTVLESFLALIISRFSGEENGRADQRPCAKALKGNVGVDEGESGRDRLNPSLLCNLEKTRPVVAGEICNRGDRTFAPEIGVGERRNVAHRSEEHTSELQSLMRISYAVFCLKKKNKHKYQD